MTMKRLVDEDLTSRMIAFRRELHSFPELSLEEEQTSKKLHPN